MLLKVITPNKTVLQEEIEELTVNTISGQIGILPHHMPLVTSIQPGEMTLKIKGKTQHYAITGGFLEVSKEGITILADYAIHSDQIEVDKAMEAKKRAEEILRKTEEGISERDFAEAQSELRRAVLELHVANRRRKERSPMPHN